MFNELKPALLMLIVMTVIAGVVYPGLVTLLAQATLPDQAAGSLIAEDGRILGSRLVGQPFSDPRHFWSRPSATGPVPYNAALSGGSNQGPLNPALETAVRARMTALQAASPAPNSAIPVDLVTASASGLDPHISPAAAQWQAARVANQNGLTEAEVADLIAAHTQQRQFGLLGEPRVNVLELNLALDQRSRH